MTTENETHNEATCTEFECTMGSVPPPPPTVKNIYTLPVSIVIAVGLIVGAWIYTRGLHINISSRLRGVTGEAEQTNTDTNGGGAVSAFEEGVLPAAGVVLPASWGSLGQELVSTGAIDENKMKAIYNERGTFTRTQQQMLLANNDGKITITSNNAGYLLNLFWALGLANKNSILENGEMSDARYGGASQFASTAGWTVAKGNPMDHYSAHTFINLTPDQQAIVERMSKGIFRPCCGNSTHFPDCNHGMAMLGLLELMASQGASEDEMWRAALAVNSYWFPDNYLTIASYMQQEGRDWKTVRPEEVLGTRYSGATEYRQIAAKVKTPVNSSGSENGCGVGGVPATTRKNSGQPVQRSSGQGCGL